MKNKIQFILLGFAVFSGSCSVMQSAVKSTFPYTTTLTIPRSPAGDTELSVTGTATSFDQRIQKDGRDADKVGDVRVVSAKIESKDPDNFNIGSFSAIKIYLSKPDSTGEVLGASRTDITPNVGNSMVLDIDNTNSLTELVHQPKIRLRMVYKLHNRINLTTQLHISLGLGALLNKK
jgi:hypothetical protein